MTEKEISDYYFSLDRCNRGNFTQFLAHETRKQSRTWQITFSRIYRSQYVAPLSNLELKFISEVIQNESWRPKRGASQ